MNPKNALICAGLIASSALTLATAPAEAAAIKFGHDGIKFDTDTTLKFDFLGSNGQYQSSFGVAEIVGSSKIYSPLLSEKAPGYDSKSPDFKGTCGITVLKCSDVFTFKKGVEYSLFLSTPATSSGYVFSTTSLNFPKAAQVKFNGLLNVTGLNPESSAVLAAFDDRGNRVDLDFNDFRVRISAIPEPATLGGLALAAGALLSYRRRRQSAN